MFAGFYWLLDKTNKQKFMQPKLQGLLGQFIQIIDGHHLFTTTISH